MERQYHEFCDSALGQADDDIGRVLEGVARVVVARPSALGSENYFACRLTGSDWVQILRYMLARRGSK